MPCNSDALCRFLRHPNPMKRDPEYLRQLLFEMEASESRVAKARQYIGMYRLDERRLHHLELLCDAGLIVDAGVVDSGYRLTSQGHDFLDAIRDPGRWRKTMDHVKGKGGDWTMEALKTLALQFLQKTLLG